MGPIIDRSYKEENIRKVNQLIISFGGVESPFTQIENTKYPFIITKLLVLALSEKTQFEKIIFTGNRKCLQLLKPQYSEELTNVTFRCLSHTAFLRELVKSKSFLTSPGLAATYEAFFYKVPVIFLPPQNYSQFLQLKRLRASDVAPQSIHWLDFFPENDIPDNLLEEEGVRRTLQCIYAFEHDSAAQEEMVQLLRLYFNKEMENLLHKQDEFLKSMGGDGARQIAKQLVEA